MSKKRRAILLAIGAAAFVVVFSVGAEVPLTEEEAKELKKEFNKQVENIDALGIFLNNLRIAATMFIPGFGIVIGLISAYSTGAVFNAIILTTPNIPDVLPAVVFATPFGAMELFAYGLAMSQSGILATALIRKQSLKLLWKPIIIEFGLVAGVLLAGAFIEFYMIEAFDAQMRITDSI